MTDRGADFPSSSEGPVPRWTSFARPGAAPTAIAGQRAGRFGLWLIALHLVLAILGPWLVTQDFAAQDAESVLLAPGAAHWLGTDHLGRDVMTRTLLGGRVALATTALGTAIAILWGSALGILAGLIGGWFDEVVLRLIDALLAIPWLLFILLVVAVAGTSMWVLVPALGFTYGLSVVRVVRGATLDLVEREFVQAARARGESRLVILGGELLPNVRDVILVEGAMEWSWMLLSFSSLSFLGFGVAPPTPDWGLMISDARLYLSAAPWTALAPMVALSSSIIAINLAADYLSKLLGVERPEGGAP
jgi:peptide/nickel transport system permease protein